MDERSEYKPTAVPLGDQRDQQAGEIRARWAWVEPTAWTIPMLTALEQGVKGGRWRWPNPLFAKHGLFSLVVASAAVVESSTR